MKSRNPKQRGAALVIGLILLVVITLLAVVGMNIANTELASATSEQLRLRAFNAAETGLETRLQTLPDDATTDPTPMESDHGRVENSPLNTVTGDAADTYSHVTTYRGEGNMLSRSFRRHIRGLSLLGRKHRPFGAQRRVSAHRRRTSSSTVSATTTRRSRSTRATTPRMPYPSRASATSRPQAARPHRILCLESVMKSLYIVAAVILLGALQPPRWPSQGCSSSGMRSRQLEYAARRLRRRARLQGCATCKRAAAARQRQHALRHRRQI